MNTDWAELGKKIGSMKDGHIGETADDAVARKVMEELFGEAWIVKTVDYAISWQPGRELAMNCLRLLKSPRAAQYAYEVYKRSEGEKAIQAVWLIKQLCHPMALDWVGEFLDDKNVAETGIGVLDQLVWNNEVKDDDRIEQLLNKADTVYGGILKPKANFIREYIQKRAGIY